MDYITFNGWLIETHEMSERSARDVISRCRRICKMLNTNEITDNTISELLNNDEFNSSSMFVKSQLKRAASLWLDYGGN
ncbi:hypothetical protein ACQQ9V_11000 [Hornefia butyriciproducens]|uniref:hypothetical protein n=1 Tax=Hornefia butyriciproducens TaxID=2652293 RepID=UPI003D046496